MSTELAVVTGASSGIGSCIAEMLLKRGYHVIGIGRNFDGDPVSREGYEAFVCDLNDTGRPLSFIGMKVREYDPKILVNCAGTAYYGLSENQTPDMIKEMVRVNLEVPVILSSFFIKHMREKGGGTIINISSVTADKVCTHAACYGATKAGLSAFSESISEEARKHGIKVIDIKPDMTDTKLYRNADFTPLKEPGACLLPEDISDVIQMILDTRSDIYIPEIRIVPRKRPGIHREGGN